MRSTRTLSIALTACSLVHGWLGARAQAAPPAAQSGSHSVLSDAPRVAAATSAPTPAPLSGAPAPGGSAASAGQTGGDSTLGPEEHARRLKTALQGLNKADPVAIQEALLMLKELRGRAAADGIVARLKLGLPPQLTESALEVLRGLEQPIAVPVLAELTLHRRWQIREKAVAALGPLRVRSSVAVLLYALDDPSPEVRSAAARALGQAGDPRAIPALTSALERGVDGALEGLAQLSSNKQVETILARAKTDLTRTEPALWVLLARPNLSPVTKLKVIQFVKSHAAEAEAAQVLSLWTDKLRDAGDLRLAAALAQAPKAAPKANAGGKP
jgi:HEAT repeat protein